MGVGTTIEWTDDTWNPVVGCSRVSPGCDHCYAMTQAPRQADRGLYEGVVADGDWTGRVNVTADPKLLYRPIRQTRPRMIFVNSMSDLFHEAIEIPEIARIFAVMALAHQHRFQVLTKRHKRMQMILSLAGFEELVCTYAAAIAAENRWHDRCYQGPFYRFGWPLPNVWLGVSVESQNYAFRCRELLATPAAVRWVSAEPLLGPLDLSVYLPSCTCGCPENTPTQHRAFCQRYGARRSALVRPGLDWVVSGGESGPKARPMHPMWARSIRDQCADAGVPFLFKQWGSWRPLRAGDEVNPIALAEDGTVAAQRGTSGQVWMVRVDKHEAGRTLDGEMHDGYPEPRP